MLRNGLGHLIKNEVSKHLRFVDLFTGSASVAYHVAKNYSLPVHAVDIQSYSIAVASAVISRTHHLEFEEMWGTWLRRAAAIYDRTRVPKQQMANRQDVELIRRWCDDQELPITRAYGGYYFSGEQAVWFDALRLSVPDSGELRTAAIAALIEAASQCAASPGHTAQPFQPTPTAIKFLQEAWARDPVAHVKKALSDVCNSRALRAGFAMREDANVAARSLMPGDLVFIDPPYSGVHYSRFYHVLETIADGDCGVVSGIGRYPHPSKRPRSLYSLKRDSANALADLLKAVADATATAILTFPDHSCSNGLSGELVRDMARIDFAIEEQYVASRFSTLGGYAQATRTDRGRHARQSASEMMLLLRPR